MAPDEIEELQFLAKNSGRLNDAGEKRLAELRGKIPGQPGFLQRQAIFAGRGAMDTYQGAKQRALQALDAQAAADYTARVGRERAALAPLEAGYPTESAVSGFIGNAASLPIPGIVGSIPSRMAFSGTVGGLHGGAQFDPRNDPANALQNALWGAGGAMGAEGLVSAGRAGLQALRARGGMPAPAAEALPPGMGGAAGATPRRFDYFDPEFLIPYTEGQATGDLARQQIEQRMTHGAFGDPAGADMRAALDYQQQRMTDAMRETGAGFVEGERGGQQMVPYGERGGRQYETMPDAGATLKNRLSARANAAWRDIGEAFDIARAAGGQIAANDGRAVVDNVIGAIDEFDAKALAADPASYPVVSGVSERLKAFIPDVIEGQPVSGMDAQALHAMRRIMSEERRAPATKPTEKRILSDMIEELDQEMLRLVDEGRLVGSESAISAMRDGISLRADYGKLYGPRGKKLRSGRNVGDKAGEAIERIIETDMDGETVANLVFGRGRLGSGEHTAKIISRVRDAAGPDSDEFQALRNMAMEKLAADVAQAGKETVSAQKMTTAWTRLRRSNSNLLNELYTRQEIAKIDRLAKAIEKTKYMDEAMNRSGTAHMLEAMFNSVPTLAGALAGGAAAGPIGAAGGAAGMWVAKQAGDRIKDQLGKVFAVRVFERAPRAMPPTPAASAAVQYREYLSEPRRRQGGR